MKVALCCIGKCENQYIREFIEYYQGLGVDKVFLFDNNDVDGERFEFVIGDLIASGYVDMIRCHGMKNCQFTAYNTCYNKNKDDYDWFLFFDCDEFLEIGGMNIKDWLSLDKFSNFDMIHVNWLIYGDNGLVKNDGGGVLERFKEPRMPNDFSVTYNFPENDHIKSIVRGGKDIVFDDNPHTPSTELPCCDTDGNDCDPKSPFIHNNIGKECHLKHFQTKTAEEYARNKMQRGYPDGNGLKVANIDYIGNFFKINEKTDEKVALMKTILKEKLTVENSVKEGYCDTDIFICSHKEFKPIVSDIAYKALYSKDFEGEMTNDLKSYKCVGKMKLNPKFYSEIAMMNWVAKNVELRDYVGFCQYRRYFGFLDKVPNFKELLSDGNGVILTTPTILKWDNYEFYDRCHNIDDLKITTNIIRDKFSDYYDEWLKMLYSRSLIGMNMFVMRSDKFLEYIGFINNILNTFLQTVGYDIERRIVVENKKYIKSMAPNNELWYQYRLGGFLAERLTHTFVCKNFSKFYYYDCHFVENN